MRSAEGKLIEDIVGFGLHDRTHSFGESENGYEDTVRTKDRKSEGALRACLCIDAERNGAASAVQGFEQAERQGGG